MRQSRLDEAMAAAEQALKIAPANREAHRVLGIVYAALSKTGRDSAAAAARRQAAGERGEGDPASRAGARAADRRARSERARDAGAAVSRRPRRTTRRSRCSTRSRRPGARVAGRPDAARRGVRGRRPQRRRDRLARATQSRTIRSLYPTLGDFYERERRWNEAAAAYAQAVSASPRNADLKTRYAQALLNAGGRDNARQGARRARRSRSRRGRPIRARCIQLSQAQRRLGRLRRPPKRRRASSSRRTTAVRDGYFALAEALEERQQYQAIVDALAPAVGGIPRADRRHRATDVGLLLPHLGFAYQELGEYDKAIATFEEAHRLAPNDPAVTAYLVEANMAAKKYAAARRSRAQRRAPSIPTICGCARLEAQALRQSGKADQAISLLEDGAEERTPTSRSLRGAGAVLCRRRARRRRGEDAAGRAGEVSRRQRRSRSSSARCSTSRRSSPTPKRRSGRSSSQDPDNAPALNYLGYMLAERGERLDESVSFLKKALQIEPENGSYLDSLGWAYFKADKLDLADDEPATRGRTAQDQLGHPGSLRRRALQARALRRSDRGVEPRARRRRRLDRSRRHRQEDQIAQSKSSARNDAALVRAPLLALSLVCARRAARR